MSTFQGWQAPSILDHLSHDQRYKFKHSQSAEYLQANSATQLNALYIHIKNKVKKIRINFEQNSYQSHDKETQCDKIAYIKNILDYFIDKISQRASRDQDSNEILCEDCKNYEQNLQKLESDIRQHIRLQQQLKLYQESLQEKIEQQRKENEKNLEKLSKLKCTMDDFKTKENNWTQKLVKLEEQNQKIKQDTIKNKSGLIGEHSSRVNRDHSQTKSIKVLQEYKQNQTGVRNFHKKQEKKEDKKEKQEKKQKDGRKSCERRPQSSERWRQNSNMNSNKHFPLAQKLIMQKNKEQKKKAIQAKFQMRR